MVPSRRVRQRGCPTWGGDSRGCSRMPLLGGVQRRCCLLLRRRNGGSLNVVSNKSRSSVSGMRSFGTEDKWKERDTNDLMKRYWMEKEKQNVWGFEMLP